MQSLPIPSTCEVRLALHQYPLPAEPQKSSRPRGSPALFGHSPVAASHHQNIPAIEGISKCNPVDESSTSSGEVSPVASATVYASRLPKMPASRQPASARPVPQIQTDRRLSKSTETEARRGGSFAVCGRATYVSGPIRAHCPNFCTFAALHA